MKKAKKTQVCPYCNKRRPLSWYEKPSRHRRKCKKCIASALKARREKVGYANTPQGRYYRKHAAEIYAKKRAREALNPEKFRKQNKIRLERAARKAIAAGICIRCKRSLDTKGPLCSRCYKAARGVIARRLAQVGQ